MTTNLTLAALLTDLRESLDQQAQGLTTEAQCAGYLFERLNLHLGIIDAQLELECQELRLQLEKEQAVA